ncbi:pentapeptide repeat-containing protein [Synechococcus sp. W4D4]|uniref:pentapeptide repeat-containing protein n=1 Tax=Synechococcus sp. W4D4 TaxID=3392294 RepID=UPI0039E7DD4A
MAIGWLGSGSAGVALALLCCQGSLQSAPLIVEPYPEAAGLGAPAWPGCPGCDLRGADLRGLMLNGIDLREADLRGADLRQSNLEGADLTGANLEGALLQDTRLSNADLSDANLSRANLSGAVMIQALTPGLKLDQTVLVGVDFTGSHLMVGGEVLDGPSPLPQLPPQ